MDRLMDNAERLALPAPLEAGARHYPPVQMVEDDDAVHIRANAPGLSLNDLRITLKSGTLTMRGCIPALSGRHVLQSRPAGPFRRDIRLPFPIEEEAVEASVHNGILSIRLPRKNGPQKRLTPVNSGKGRIMDDAWHSFSPAGPANSAFRQHGGDEKSGRAVPPLTVIPLIDMVELPDGACLYCNLPGAAPADVSLTAEGQFLFLRAEARYEPVPGKIHALEFCDTSYVGRILLPRVDVDRAEASVCNGILRIFMPFPPKMEPARIPVAAG